MSTSIALDNLTNNRVQVLITKFPQLSARIKKASLPGASIQTLYLQGNTRRLPEMGETVEFQQLDIEFLMDEQLEVHETLFSWMESINNTDYGSQRREELFTTVTYLFFDSTGNNTRKLTFNDVIISDLGFVAVDFQEEERAITLNASFSYSFYEYS